MSLRAHVMNFWEQLEPRIQEAGYNPQLTPGAHSLLGGQGARIKGDCSSVSIPPGNPGLLSCEASVLPLHYGDVYVCV